MEHIQIHQDSQQGICVSRVQSWKQEKKKSLPRKGRGHMKSYYYITKMEEECQEKRKEGP